MVKDSIGHVVRVMKRARTLKIRFQWNLKTRKRHKSRDKHGARFSNIPTVRLYIRIVRCLKNKQNFDFVWVDNTRNCNKLVFTSTKMSDIITKNYTENRIYNKRHLHDEWWWIWTKMDLFQLKSKNVKWFKNAMQYLIFNSLGAFTLAILELKL